MNEYEGEAYFLREGRVTPVPALSELEELEIPPLGTLEAFVTSGGLSTMPWTFEGKLQVLENKTLRYPGHCQLLHGLRALGFFSRDAISMGGVPVVPRDLLIALFERFLFDPEVRDVCVIHVRARGIREGHLAEARVSLVDYHDPKTGFRAMEKLTGWHAAIVLAFAVRGEIPPGATPIERALSGDQFLAACPARGWTVDFSVNSLE